MQRQYPGVVAMHKIMYSQSLRLWLVRGYTLLEILVTVALVGILSAIALPNYQSVLEKQKVSQAVRDLTEISMKLQSYHTLHFAFPQSLADIGYAPLPNDPWGSEYQYLNFDSLAKGAKSKIRKDHNLHPLNTSMDLYSMGPDGKSVAPLTAKASRDDIIWARDGGFVGVAEEF